MIGGERKKTRSSSFLYGLRCLCRVAAPACSDFLIAKMVTTHSFPNCECDVVNGTLHGSGGEKADALSPSLINPGVGSESSLRLSLVA
jgi:hypothetical protein